LDSSGNPREAAANNPGEAANNPGEAANNPGEAANNPGEAANNPGEAANNHCEAERRNSAMRCGRFHRTSSAAHLAPGFLTGWFLTGRRVDRIRDF
jgi:hypothetical protein